MIKQTKSRVLRVSNVSKTTHALSGIVTSVQGNGIGSSSRSEHINIYIALTRVDAFAATQWLRKTFYLATLVSTEPPLSHLSRTLISCEPKFIVLS